MEQNGKTEAVKGTESKKNGNLNNGHVITDVKLVNGMVLAHQRIIQRQTVRIWNYIGKSVEIDIYIDDNLEQKQFHDVDSVDIGVFQGKDQISISRASTSKKGFEISFYRRFKLKSASMDYKNLVVILEMI
jgi:hypothetical protein